MVEATKAHSYDEDDRGSERYCQVGHGVRWRKWSEKPPSTFDQYPIGVPACLGNGRDDFSRSIFTPSWAAARWGEMGALKQ